MCGCASLSGTRQVVSFDSQPRGVQVQDEQGKPLGITPFFAQLPRQPEQSVEVVRPHRPLHRERFRFACGYRWWSSLLPNAALGTLAAGSGPLGMAALLGIGGGIDLWSGAAWDCPQSVQLPAEPAKLSAAAAEERPALELAAPATPAEAPRQCRLVVVGPPHHPDILVSQRLADQAWQQHRQSAPCDRRVDADEAEKLLRRLGMSHERPLQVSASIRRLLYELGWRTQAGYLLNTAVRADGDHLHATPSLCDLHTLQCQVQSEFAVDLALSRQPAWRRGLAWLGQHMQLLPDSVGFAPTWKTLPFTGLAPGQLLSNDDAPSVLPSLVGNWTLLSVEHPGALSPWDATWRVGPRILFGYAARRLSWRNGPEGLASPQAAEVTLLELGGLYEITGALHTPAGAVSMSAGGGWAGVGAWQGEQSLGWRVPFTASAGMAWTAFVTENLFIRGELLSYASSGARVQGPGYALKEWTAASVTAGWYAPEWRRWVRSWF